MIGLIYVTGDTHIPIDISKLNTKNFPEQSNLTRNDYLVILGDFGLFWKNDKTHEHWKRWLEEKPFSILWIDGNHENFDWIKTFPVTEWHGGKVQQTSDNIIHLMRGETYEIEGKVFLAAGGANSIDIMYRTPHVSWWPDELWSYEEQDNILSKIDDHIDYVLSHTCPCDIVRSMFRVKDNTDPTTKLLQEVYDEIGSRIKGWYFGHWHEDKDLDIFHCLYNDIKQIE